MPACGRATGRIFFCSTMIPRSITDDWIEAMLEQAQRPEIGVVGARLLYEDGALQHAGVVIGLGELAGHIYRGAPRDDHGPAGEILTIRNYSAVTAACMMVRRDVFEAVGGFDEKLAVEFNDTDFCLRVLRAVTETSMYLTRSYIITSPNREVPVSHPRPRTSPTVASCFGNDGKRRAIEIPITTATLRPLPMTAP